MGSGKSFGRAPGASPLVSQSPARILECSLHVFYGQAGIRREQIVEVRMSREMRDDALDGNAGSLNHGLARHNFWIPHYAVLVQIDVFCHARTLHSLR
jgi:hypothetical protein